MYRLFHPGFDLDVESDDPRISNPSFPLICDSEYIQLMHLCFSRATLFSMTRAKWDSSTNESLEKDLKPFLKKTIKTCHWFCYGVREDSPLDILIFQANRETEGSILKYFRDIFLHHRYNGEWRSSTQTLEDLCFFSQNRLFLGTVTHEELCYIYPPDKQFESFIRGNSYWIAEVDSYKQQVNLSQYGISI